MTTRIYKVKSKSNPGTFHDVFVLEVKGGHAYRCDCIGYTSRKQDMFVIAKDWSCSHIKQTIAKLRVPTEVKNEK